MKRPKDSRKPLFRSYRWELLPALLIINNGCDDVRHASLIRALESYDDYESLSGIELRKRSNIDGDTVCGREGF